MVAGNRERVATVAIGLDEPWIDTNGIGILGDRQVAVTFCEIRMSTIATGSSECGIDPDCLRIIGDRIVISFFHGVEVTPQIVGPRKVWVEPHRLAEMGDRPVTFPLWRRLGRDCGLRQRGRDRLRRRHRKYGCSQPPDGPYRTIAVGQIKLTCS
jgi:hypothetical protein